MRFRWALWGGVVAGWLTPVGARAGIEDQNVPKQQEPEPPPPQPVLTKPPQLEHFANAAYPEELLLEGVGGEAVLLIDIDAEGRVERVTVQSVSHPPFAVPAMVAAAQFRFSPAEIDDVPAGIRIEYRYVFEPEMPEPDAIAGEPTERSEVDQRVNFAGLIREAAKRTPIAGAIIKINGLPVAESDAKGYYEIRGVKPGKLKIQVTSPYHRTYKGKETLEENQKIEAKYYLVRTSYDPYETVVHTTAERKEVAKIQLQRKELEKVPGTFGDPIRVIENLPGMARVPGGLGGALLVRGANPTDTAVFIDGVQIPLLYHFGGLTSVVNAQFLERIDFYPGGFGARYGRAIAGIVDVVTRDTGCEQARGHGKLDILDTALFLCLPIMDWEVAGAARRSYIDALLPLVLDAAVRDDDEGALTAAPVYFDYQVKAHRNYENHMFDVFAFGSDDSLELVTAGSTENVNVDVGLDISFHRLLLRHRWKINDRMSLNTQLTPGVVLTEFGASSADIGLDNKFLITIWSVAWREDFEWKITDNWQLNAGVDFGFGSADFDFSLPVPTSVRDFPDPTFDFTQSAEISEVLGQFNNAYYLEAIYETDFRLKLIPGLRFDVWDFDQTETVSVLPRLTARWEFLDGMTAKAAYGLYEKLPDPPQITANLGNPNLPPLRTHQFIIGYEHQFTELFSVDLQGFYNLRQRIPVPTSGSTVSGGQRQRELFVASGEGRTFGMELLVRYLATESGWFYGWIAYTLSRSFRRDRPEGSATTSSQGATVDVVSQRETQEYPAPFDQPHILTVVAQFVGPWGFELGLRFRLVSGNPQTPQNQGPVFYDADSAQYRVDNSGVERNSERLPPFHQLDVRLEKTFTFSLWKLTAYIEVLNVYNASNVESYQYDYRFEQRVPLTFLPIVPVLGVKGEF